MLIAFSVAILVLSVISGMLGIGVAIVAVPVLSLGLSDLVNQVHPLSLILNGVTALLSAAAFAKSGLIDWPKAGFLATIATLGAPLGSLLARSTPEWAIWAMYFLSVTFLCYRMLRTSIAHEGAPVRLTAILVIAFPASVVSGFVGVGPGFLLVPLMIHFGIDIRKAAAINAVAVTPSSFAAAAPHYSHMTLEPAFVATLCIAGATGSYIGGHLASKKVSPIMLRRIFLCTIIGTTGLRAIRLLA